MKKLSLFQKQFFTVWSNHNDEMWKDKNLALQKLIPEARGQKHLVLEANHFTQEDQPKLLAKFILEIVEKNR